MSRFRGPPYMLGQLEKESKPSRQKTRKRILLHAACPFHLEGGLLGAGSMDMHEFSVGWPEWMFGTTGLVARKPFRLGCVGVRER